MPNDSVYLNLKAVQQHTYDAIVVGSGISGGWAAKELCEAGLKVLVIERGRMVHHPNYPTAATPVWQLEHRNRLTTAIKRDYFIQSRHYSFQEDNYHFYNKDIDTPYIEKQRFDWVRGDVLGGRSLLWARMSPRWSDLDFEANAKDGWGIDWPLRYRHLAPWYSYVEKFAGISGNKDGIAHMPDGDFLPPFEMNVAEKHFKEQLEKNFDGRKVIIGRTANLTKGMHNRVQCQARNLCHRGCPFGAYFSSNSSTLPAAQATGNLTVITGAIAARVMYNEQKQKASGITIIDRDTLEERTFYARIIFINASAVATTALLLQSTSSRFPNGLGNGSDQVGRNLMDHHKGLSFSGEIEGMEDYYYYGNRPTSLIIPRFVNIGNDKKEFLRGYHYVGGASRPRNADTGAIGIALKEALSQPGAWRISISAYGECLPYANNRIFLSKTEKDKWGLPLVETDCSFKENEIAMHKDMAANGLEMLEKTGVKNPSVSGSISYPGNANHEMGTARMGNDPKTSVLNAFNQMHEVPNVFITDGSCMTSSSSLNPSLTYMALTARACNYAIGEMKKGNI